MTADEIMENSFLLTSSYRTMMITLTRTIEENIKIDHSSKNNTNRDILGSRNVKLANAYTKIFSLSCQFLPSDISKLPFIIDKRLVRKLMIPGRIPRQRALPAESMMQSDAAAKGWSNLFLPYKINNMTIWIGLSKEPLRSWDILALW